jgi:hypothetical protein
MGQTQPEHFVCVLNLQVQALMAARMGMGQAQQMQAAGQHSTTPVSAFLQLASCPGRRMRLSAGSNQTSDSICVVCINAPPVIPQVQPTTSPFMLITMVVPCAGPVPPHYLQNSLASAQSPSSLVGSGKAFTDFGLTRSGSVTDWAKL